ncbi:MAG TPA: GTP cyclohydrolase I FolE [Chitinophagaceae bacterium]|nr:GTP cyclohydrolase I FolE [Chitinophagaceae bacterium]
MKTNGTILTMSKFENDLQELDHHETSSFDTPLRPDAFSISDEEKIRIIAGHFSEIMRTLGLDLQDDSLKDTAGRVAKMYVKEIFGGLNPANKPSVTLFENKYGYHQMLVAKNIQLQTTCEHHFLPVTGSAHIAYIPSAKIIGLSKINRLVRYYAGRPQVQERLTNQLANELKHTLGTEDIAVVIDAVHSCVSARGVEDQTSSTVTSYFSGKFNREETKNEFMAMIR